MKKFALFIIFCFAFSHFTQAQNKIYVSRQGGTKKFLTFGKIGYNDYYFSHRSFICDTLICRGSGYETFLLPVEAEGSKYAKAFIKAIHATTKQVRKTGKGAGQFELIYGSKTFSVEYSNADKKGNADILIEAL